MIIVYFLLGILLYFNHLADSFLLLLLLIHLINLAKKNKQNKMLMASYTKPQ